MYVNAYERCSMTTSPVNVVAHLCAHRPCAVSSDDRLCGALKSPASLLVLGLHATMQSPLEHFSYVAMLYCSLPMKRL